MPGCSNHLAIFAGAAVGDGRLVGIQFDDGVVDAIAGESRQHVFDRVDSRVALGERRGAVGFDHVLDPRFDLRFAFEVDAAEADAGIGRRRQKSHVDPVAAVQANAGITGGAIECLLLKHPGI